MASLTSILAKLRIVSLNFLVHLSPWHGYLTRSGRLAAQFIDMAKPDMSTIRLQLRFCSCSNTSVDDISLVHDTAEVDAKDLAILSGPNITEPKVKSESLSCPHSCSAPTNSPSVSLATETEPISPGELALALSPGTVVVSPGNFDQPYGVSHGYGVESLPEPYIPPFPNLRAAMEQYANPWTYGVDPVLGAASDPSPPRGIDVLDRAGTGLGAYGKVLRSPEAHQSPKQEDRPPSSTSSIGNFDHSTLSYRALLTK